MKSNLRNEIKSYIVRQGMTMQEVVDLLRDEHGWSDSVSNLSNKLQRESLRYVEAVQLAEALQISKAGAYNLLSSPDFPTLQIGGRKLVMKNELVEWLKSRTNKTT